MIKRIKQHFTKNKYRKSESLKNTNNYNNNKYILKIITKILLILFITYGFYTLYNSYSNSITLMAVNEDSKGNPLGGSTVSLNLKITPGSGQVFTNLNTIEEVDTQISIINSQKIACNLFSLPCEKYDFYYTFTDSAIVLKGPSASSAIAILTAKTLKHEKIDNTVVITGSLNSGGIIGTVGGIEQKIKVAKSNNFSKILIPLFSDYKLKINGDNNTNETIQNDTIQIIQVFDLIDAYNNFNGHHYELKNEKINEENYKSEMEKLSMSICDRTVDLQKKINFENIVENSSIDTYKKQADKSNNASENALNNNNFYSRGSFCYNSNINYRLIIENQKNLSLDERNLEIEKLRKEINLKYVEVMSKDYKVNITTTNDFYVYLLMIDRIEEAKEYLTEAEKLNLKLNENTIDITSSININETNITTENINDTIELTKNIENNQITDVINNQKLNLYSYAFERYYTVNVWEEFITHTGNKIEFTDDKISESCHKINKEITVKNELLTNYNLNYLSEQINKQKEFENPFSNKYLCLYSGIELNGKINTIFNSFGLTEENQKNYSLTLVEFANKRVPLNSNGDFPLIPYMYAEYAKDLYSQGDFGSAMLYSNYALSYNDLNLYLEEETKTISKFNYLIKELFSNTIFVIAILVLVVFL